MQGARKRVGIQRIPGGYAEHTSEHNTVGLVAHIPLQAAEAAAASKAATEAAASL